MSRPLGANTCHILRMNLGKKQWVGREMSIVSFSAVPNPCIGSGIIVNESSGSLESPGFEAAGTGTYAGDLDCYWTITTPAAEVITTQISTSLCSIQQLLLDIDFYVICLFIFTGL